MRSPGPFLLVTVDVEGDNLWARPAQATTRNARCLPRFQELCDSHGCRPTFLATYEMACCADFRRFGREILDTRRGEIGMHLHAWNSPPRVPLTALDSWYQPHLTHYPEEVMRRKIAHLTHTLEDAFGVPMRSHRAGRWAFDETYARLLVEQRYQVDSSVTPGVSWKQKGGTRFEDRAPDYTHFAHEPYFVDLGDIRLTGASPLLEVPMTTCRIPLDSPAGHDAGAPFVVRWLRPNGRNGRALRQVARQSLDEGRGCLVLMLHSSELLPGGSPVTQRLEQVEALLQDLSSLLAELRKCTVPVTLSELYEHFALARPETAPAWST